jgi:peptidoglycan hydrolase-like protein with peptidoglycan-binding domain
MVDLIFNRYIRRMGHLEPFFAEYCDGRRVQCPGLWQWSTVTLANQGRDALQILRNFYPNDIQIVETDNIGGVTPSFPGFELRPGMTNPSISTVQTWLNRIRVNFPTIPAISAPSGVYGPQTEAAVRAFQNIASLSSVSPNGIVGRVTWNNISRAFSAVKSLGELTSEGIIMGIGRVPPTSIVRQGDRGRLVQQAQYILNFIAQFYPVVPTVIQNSNFTADTTNAVREFQRNFGMNPDGIIGPATWNRMYEVYWNIRDRIPLPPWSGGGTTVPPGPPVEGIPQYPGQLIRVGSRGADVERIQRCLNSLSSRFPSIPRLNPDGVFGPLTQASVREFQRLFGLNSDGIVGPLTWNALMPECHARPVPTYPGYPLRLGMRNDYVRQIQTCLNYVNGAGLSADGIFGPLTNAAVVNYQRANGLTADGVVGPVTWENLMRRCQAGGGPASLAASAAAEAEAVSEPVHVPVAVDIINQQTDSSSLVLEFAPNFAAVDNTRTEFMEETLGVVEQVMAGSEEIAAERVHAESKSVKKINLSNLLMYLLVREMKK